jgi:hypothetical protein
VLAALKIKTKINFMFTIVWNKNNISVVMAFGTVPYRAESHQLKQNSLTNMQISAMFYIAIVTDPRWIP